MMETVLETTQLCKNYRRFRALDGVTMRVPKGAIYGLVGRNGRGKTTLPQRRNGHLPVSLRQTFGRVINSLLRYTFRNG